jgi:hypothetical protein
MGACPSRNQNQSNEIGGTSNSQQPPPSDHGSNDEPNELFFTDGSSYKGSMIFSKEDKHWIQHGNGIYIFNDGTKALAKFKNGKFDLDYSVQVTYAGSGRQYSGRMSMFEGQPFPHGNGVLRETKQGRIEKQEGEFKEGVLYNGALTLKDPDTSVNIEVKVKEGKIVLPDKSKNASQNRPSWYDQLEEEWEEQKSKYGYSNQDVWFAYKAADELIRAEEGKEKGKPNSSTIPRGTTNKQSKRRSK